MAALETLGAFALTEPMHGSDSVGLEASARRDGDEWVIEGTKKWIGNCSERSRMCGGVNTRRETADDRDVQGGEADAEFPCLVQTSR